MKKLSWVFFILVSIALFAISTFTSYAPRYIGGSYYESSDFQLVFDSRLEEIGPVLLNRLDVEEEIKKLKVEPYEIEEYRTYYGSQMDQIRSVQDQYIEMITEAENNGDSVLKADLEKERDAKIAEIRKNFTDSQYVSDKILAAKENVLRSYDEKITDILPEAKEQQKLLAYDLINIQTGEHFTHGNMEDSTAYKKTFNERDGYLSISNLRNDLVDFESAELQPLSVYNLNGITGDDTSQFKGTVTIPKNMLSGEYALGLRSFERSKWILAAIWLAGFMAAAIAFWLFRTKRKDVTPLPVPNAVGAWNLEARAAGLLIALVGASNAYYPLTYQLVNPQYINGDYIGDTGIMTIMLLAFLVLTIVQAIWLVHDYRKDRLSQLWDRSMMKKLMQAMEGAFLKRSLGIQITLLAAGVFLGGLGLGGVILAPWLVAVYAPMFIFILLPILYLLFKRVADYNKIAVATEHMAKGQLTGDVHIKGKSVLAEHARNLNKLREGVRVSQSEQAKSERLKTELITNVSHDLRTPLTSIITYTDLLKNPDLPEGERMNYVSILDRKSQRLKTLIEDLFEVSKMASGNLELNKNRVDLAQMMQQALAEHQEEIQGARLDFRVSAPEGSLYASVDGQKWWRVLDNLIVNAIKYTLPGTRVYVSLKETNGAAEFTIKNVTKYELGENVDELFERFKRADTSRHTDGSGLGLAIAQSIVDLHGGSMRIEVDGDLFKVKVMIMTM